MSIFNAADHFALNFVHKRLIRAATGFVASGGNPLGALGGFVSPSGEGGPPVLRAPTRPTVARTQTARPSAAGAREQEAGRGAKFGGGASSLFGGSDGCILPFRRDPLTGSCRIFAGTQSGRDPVPTPTRGPTRAAPAGPVGEAVMGRYGAGLVPGSQIVDRAVCLRGMRLGDDGLCYSNSQISNKQRMWPRGRKPLLTGGEMRAITVASSASRRLTRTAVRLQDMGLIKKPIARAYPKKKK